MDSLEPLETSIHEVEVEGVGATDARPTLASTTSTYSTSTTVKPIFAKSGWKCTQCPYVGDREHLLKHHIKRGHSTRRYQCNICSGKFTSRNEMMMVFYASFVHIV